VLSQSERPACLVFSRQATPTIDRAKYASAEGLRRGAYVVAGGKDPRPQVILIATGAEVDYAIQAHERLTADGVKSRVVSMPCWGWFEEQDKAYRDAVLPPDVTARVVIEAASPIGWDRYAGASGEIIAMRSFGASAPASDLFKHFGFTVDRVVEAARAQIEGGGASPSRTSGSDDQSTQGGPHQ
jgi:transketolase